MTEKVIAYLRSGSSSVPVTAAGTVVPFENEHFVGSLFFLHHRPNSARERVDAQRAQDPGCHWEIQIQGRFKIAPSGGLSCGGELPSLPFGLSHVFKSMCSLVLRGVQVKRSRHNNASMLCFPLIHSDRLCRSLVPIQLPVEYLKPTGTWDWMGGRSWGTWFPVEWRAAGFDTHHYYAFTFSSPHVDWENWRLTKIPGLDSLDLQKCWGHQGCSVQLCDGHDHCFVQLDFLPPVAREFHDVCHLRDLYAVDDNEGISTASTLGMECEWNCYSSHSSNTTDYSSHFSQIVASEDEDAEYMDSIPDELRMEERSPKLALPRKFTL